MTPMDLFHGRLLRMRTGNDLAAPLAASDQSIFGGFRSLSLSPFDAAEETFRGGASGEACYVAHIIVMPQRCAAVGCTNSSGRPPNMRFFRFPAASLQEARRRKWIHAIRCVNPDGSPWQPTANSRERHHDSSPTRTTYRRSSRMQKRYIVDPSLASIERRVGKLQDHQPQVKMLAAPHPHH
ncbi:hypothetical protein HPB49_025167 [Dermacentor silvarum]|uniref:Uncharacterized protein n=1 Tax=Dermacentor silvarum TaxID=543639 RepID=A0ACB8DHK8_DERSI|nr:hypothetical protein HPB49_025167 [Dermacentor silvarum]